MSVPPRRVDEDCDLAALPGQVGHADDSANVTPPTSHAGGVERAAKAQLELGISAADEGHPPAALLRRERIGHRVKLTSRYERPAHEGSEGEGLAGRELGRKRTT
jgi:hypothetical protein